MGMFRRVLGWGMISMAGLGFIGMVNKPPRNPGGTAIVLGVMALGGVSLARSRRGQRELAAPVPSGELAAEQAVLKLARALRGRVTAAEVAAESGLPLREIQGQLTALEASGTCSSLVGESGILIYHFAEFENPGAKREVFAGDQPLALHRASEREPGES